VFDPIGQLQLLQNVEPKARNCSPVSETSKALANVTVVSRSQLANTDYRFMFWLLI
jgi:hypothetical protein